MNDIAIPLSDLRKLWRQAMWAWGSNSDGSATDLWRHYVQQEIARRTIVELRARVATPAAGVLTDEVREVIQTLCASVDRNAPFELYKAKVIVKAWLKEQEVNDATGDGDA